MLAEAEEVPGCSRYWVSVFEVSCLHDGGISTDAVLLSLYEEGD